jgi:DNA-binding LacI/PurR family transcriptional regulator
LPVGPYNLPDWKNDPDDLRRCLHSLFRNTPPTAMIIDEAFLFNVVQQHLAHLGVVAPRDVSLVCLDPYPTFAWHRPSIAHVHWDSRKVVQHVIRWANNVARGKPDREQHLTKATFVEGGTIGQVSRR